jgi:hypothetical protein
MFQTISKVTWRIKSITTLSMTLKAYDHDDAPSITIPLILPQDGSTLSLQIYNVMNGEEPGGSGIVASSAQQQLAHFTAYYDIFSHHPCDPRQPLVPCYEGKAGGGGVGPYSCMLTGGGG